MRCTYFSCTFCWLSYEWAAVTLPSCSQTVWLHLRSHTYRVKDWALAAISWAQPPVLTTPSEESSITERCIQHGHTGKINNSSDQWHPARPTSGVLTWVRERRYVLSSQGQAVLYPSTDSSFWLCLLQSGRTSLSRRQAPLSPMGWHPDSAFPFSQQETRGNSNSFGDYCFNNLIAKSKCLSLEIFPPAKMTEGKIYSPHKEKIRQTEGEIISMSSLVNSN